MKVSKKEGFTLTPKNFSVSSQSKRGFTMIELLVSLAIIAMLFAAVMVLVGGIKEKSRDAKRLSDVKEISKALALYIDNKGQFPIETDTIIITGTDSLSVALKTEGAISEVPTDPIYPVYSYTYQSNANGNTYVLLFCLETDTIPNYSKGCGNIITP